MRANAKVEIPEDTETNIWRDLFIEAYECELKWQFGKYLKIIYL